MGLFSGISESVISSFLCDYLRKYAGPGCANLRIAIEKNIDLYQLWVENAHAEGVRGPNEVRTWTHLFPHAQNMSTPRRTSSGGSGSGSGEYRPDSGGHRGRR